MPKPQGDSYRTRKFVRKTLYDAYDIAPSIGRKG
jgi:hypothetical protein